MKVDSKIDGSLFLRQSRRCASLLVQHGTTLPQRLLRSWTHPLSVVDKESLDAVSLEVWTGSTIAFGNCAT